MHFRCILTRSSKISWDYRRWENISDPSRTDHRRWWVTQRVGWIIRVAPLRQENLGNVLKLRVQFIFSWSEQYMFRKLRFPRKVQWEHLNILFSNEIRSTLIKCNFNTHWIGILIVKVWRFTSPLSDARVCDKNSVSYFSSDRILT